MKFLNYVIIGLIVISCACTNTSKTEKEKQQLLAPNPPLGWNSFDSYGVYLHEEAAMANVEAFAEKLERASDPMEVAELIKRTRLKKGFSGLQDRREDEYQRFVSSD